MGNLFVRVLNMSITAGWIVLAVIVLRMILKKSPKWIHCILWAMVGLRLILPVSITSPLSLIPHSESVGRMFEEAAVISGTVVDNDFDGATETVGDNDFAGVSETITANEAVGITENAFYSIEVPTFVRMPESEPAGNFTVQNAEKARRWTDIAAVIWIVVTSGMLIYMAVSTVCIRRKVKEAVRLSDNVYGCDRVSSPFILGLFKPCIYLPSDIDDTDRQYVLAHERIHIKRLDYIWKPLSFVLLSVYWFNPLMWVAYVLLCRDIELACDEKVLREYGDTIKRAYSETLINYSISRKSISACPLAFGETGVKGRVRNILNYRKPAFWVIVISIIACIAVAVCFLTNPDSDADTDVVMAGSESPSNAVLTEPEVIEPNETELVFFKDRDGNQLRFKVIDKFTAYEGNSVDSDTFEVLPGGSELLEFISTDENEWVQFKFKEQTGWVQYQLTSDPWISHYLVDTNRKLFPMRAVMVSTWEINNLGFSETPMQELNVILHGRNIDTDFETLLKADVVNGEEISSDYFDVYIKEVGKVNYFFNLHMYSIENRYGVYSGAPGSNMLVLALFDKTENYLMDVCYLSGDKFEVQLLGANGLPTALCKVFNKDDSGEYALSETEFVRTGTEIEMNAAYELEAGRKYGVVLPGGRGTGYSVDYLHLLSIKENGEAGIAVVNNDTLIAKIKSKFRVSVLENVTTANGAQVLDVEIDDDGIRHYEFGLERNDYSFEYVYWGQLVFFEYDETENCMYMECIPSFFFKMAGNDATVDDGIEYPPKCRARLSIGEDGSVSISDMEWLLADYETSADTSVKYPGTDVDNSVDFFMPVGEEAESSELTIEYKPKEVNGLSDERTQKDLILSVSVSSDSDIADTVKYESAGGSCSGPTAFCISANVIYILDTYNFRVAVYDEGKVSYIDLEGIVGSPFDIAVNDNEIYVFDQMSREVYIFSVEGILIDKVDVSFANASRFLPYDKYGISLSSSGMSVVSISSADHSITGYDNKDYASFKDEGRQYDVRRFIAPFAEGKLFLLCAPAQDSSVIAGEISLIYSTDAASIETQYVFPLAGSEAEYVPENGIKIYNNSVYVMECYKDTVCIYRLILGV